MIRRFAMEVEYDGTNYCGWQRQANDPSIQATLEDALSPLNHQLPVVVIGSGRTDSGVHATGQMAHVDLDNELSAETIEKALNATIPDDIFVKNCREVEKDFHARFWAKRRTYLYYVLSKPDIFRRKYAWFPGFDYDRERLDRCAVEIIGEHDFTRLCLTSTEAETRICTIFDSRWETAKENLIYQIVGNRFLHSMVRILVGSMMEVARGKYTIADFKNLLDNPTGGMQVYTAPARGLFLQGVQY
ncbi:MAG: tRNA pseudouridine(38-40) synthase TruA [Candidatus Marinimicrobia bacterium]|nr:tRNA pseudouridine(38-40) synthase TruA [Candidatus Neomarinimicrobiota bacterium]